MDAVLSPFRPEELLTSGAGNCAVIGLYACDHFCRMKGLESPYSVPFGFISAQESHFMKDELKRRLMPLYSELLQAVPEETDARYFCAQWGAKFPARGGVLFVGKATNDWFDEGTVAGIFGAGDNRSFDRDDQMRWVLNHPTYNSRRSAFWRLVRNLTQSIYGPEEDWVERIAWSNLYKAAPSTGNPSGTMVTSQLPVAREILRTEIEVMKPALVVFLTSFWENRFTDHLYEGRTLERDGAVTWDGYETRYRRFNDVTFMETVHPQGKSGPRHLQALLDVLAQAGTQIPGRSAS